MQLPQTKMGKIWPCQQPKLWVTDGLFGYADSKPKKPIEINPYRSSNTAALWFLLERVTDRICLAEDFLV